jgi:hypothetical protein
LASDSFQLARESEGSLRRALRDNNATPSGDNATLEDADSKSNTSMDKLCFMRFLITDTPKGDRHNLLFLEFSSTPDVGSTLIVSIARSSL